MINIFCVVWNDLGLVFSFQIHLCNCSLQVLLRSIAHFKFILNKIIWTCIFGSYILYSKREFIWRVCNPCFIANNIKSLSLDYHIYLWLSAYEYPSSRMEKQDLYCIHFATLWLALIDSGGTIGQYLCHFLLKLLILSCKIERKWRDLRCCKSSRL